MSPILNKAQMTEEDIKLQFITPAITAKWSKDLITMETKITDGKINLKGNLVVREKPKKADYVLYLHANQPIAIVEAKDNNHSVSHGLQQAMTYAQMLDVPFAYSSNGDAFYEQPPEAVIRTDRIRSHTRGQRKLPAFSFCSGTGR